MKLSGHKKLKLKTRLFDEQGGLCFYCNKEMAIDVPEHFKNKATLDHILPINKGGTWAKTNLLLACRHCNNYKGCVIIPDWLIKDKASLCSLFKNKQIHTITERTT